MPAKKEDSEYTHEEIYADDAAIQLDIGAKNSDSDNAGALKLARDGHVSWDTKTEKEPQEV
jgi:hypothetical protein